MSSVHQTDVPDFSLLRTHRTGSDPTTWDHFRDCFVVELPGRVTLGDYVAAFYSTLPFRMERWLLGRLIAKPSGAADVAALARGECQCFSAWVVLERTDNQLLLQDFRGRTRSWLAIMPTSGGTRLHFGSGIRAARDPQTRQPRKTWGFRVLGGFHVLYSRILLGSAARALGQG